MKEYQAIFFDAGETLIHPRPSFEELFSQVCRSYGIDVSVSNHSAIGRRLFDGISEKQKSGFTFTTSKDTSKRFWLDFYSEYLFELNIENNNEEIARELYRTFSLPANYDAYTDAEPTLKILGRAGYILGVISNFESWLGNLLEDLDLSGYFQHLLISAHIGVEKPHPEIFRLALAQAGVDAACAVHVGDSLISDVAGARQVGMEPILLDRWDRYPQADCLRVGNLEEIPALLTQKL